MKLQNTQPLSGCSLKLSTDSHIEYVLKLRGLSPQTQTIPTERPPLVSEVSANFSG
jgi:hypothetical protein